MKTVVTGLVGSFSSLLPGHVVVTNMTGDVVFAGFGIAGARDFPLADGSGGGSGRRRLSAAVMCLGACLGAAAVLHGHPTLPLLIGAALLVGVTIVAFAVARTGCPWTDPVATPGVKSK